MTPIIIVCGERNAGKTTWACALVEVLAGRGLRVGTVKHTHHHYDVPGKDTERHQGAGAQRVLLASSTGCAVYEPWTEEPSLSQLAESHFADYDLVIAEGYRSSSLPKIIVGPDARANRDGLLLEVETAAGSVSDEALAGAVERIQSWLGAPQETAVGL